MAQSTGNKSSWYYQKKGTNERFGPLTDRELKQRARDGQLVPDDLLWREGMASAVPASRVKGLFSTTTPQPVSPAPSSVSQSTGSNQQATSASSKDSEIYGLSEPEVKSVAVPLANGAVSESQNPAEWQPSPLKKARAQQAAQAALINALESNDDSEDSSREEQLWKQGVMDEYPIWSGLWNIIDRISGKSFGIRLVIGIVLAIMSGLICGAIDSINPFMYLSIIFFVIAGGVVGMGVYEIFRRTGIHSRIYSSICGAFIACVTLYFTIVGSIFCDGALGRIEVGALESLSPVSVVQYLNIKKDTMVVRGRFKSSNPKPDKFGNCFLMILLYGGMFATIIAMSSAPSKLQSEIDANPEEAERVINMVGAAGRGGLFRE